MHLFYLVHGLYGRSSDMDTMKTQLEETLPEEEYVVYVAKHNATFHTFEGIKLGGYRIYTELLKYLEHNPDITHISVVGYSMGGLYVRYMVGLMHETNFFKRITPVNFVTFATPHLGTTLWEEGYRTHILNGLARVLLGPSGVDLMSRGPRGVLDKMVEPNSQFMRGLKQFRNLNIFCNAIGDRTVRFWTSFITNKTPFKKSHKYECDLVFHTYNEDPFTPVFVDMNQSAYKVEPDEPYPPSKSRSWPPLFYVLIGPIMLTMFSVSIFCWIKLPILLPYFRMQVKKCTSAWEKHKEYHESVLSSDTQEVGGIEEGLHLALEDLPPPEEPPRVLEGLRTSTFPVPCVRSAFVESSKYEITFTSNMQRRMQLLNTLSWKKYVVYSNHYRTHASIIDRLKEGPSKGTEGLRFFAESILKQSNWSTRA